MSLPHKAQTAIPKDKNGPKLMRALFLVAFIYIPNTAPVMNAISVAGTIAHPSKNPAAATNWTSPPPIAPR